MARNAKVMKLWTAIVTAFLALCTALGFVSATTAAAVPQTETPRNSSGDEHGSEQVPDRVRIPAQTHWLWSQARSLPPTMKQRIRAEAHGKTPSCRHRALDTTESETAAETPSEQLDC
ncbi:DUF6344 domain-containing protein [Streptomyces sp. NPDC090075]|uniref:DUF6344 domain-containing protein n=1 Tax=unclassified Streptomyces TaxID=2593676 RepID=UPI00381DAFFE